MKQKRQALCEYRPENMYFPLPSLKARSLIIAAVAEQGHG